MRKNILTEEEFEEMKRWMDFCPEEGKVYWIKKSSRGIKIGDEAGCYEGKKGNQYWVIRFHYKLYLRSYLIYLFVHGNPDPKLDIDHKDGNSFNDKIENLEAKTHQMNGYNRKGPNRNKKMKLPLGVSYCLKWGKKHFQACLSVNGKNKSIYCSTKEEASHASQALRKKYLGEFT